MHKGRTEAFSDGVIAIIITIMVLELKAPEGHDFASLLPLWPKAVSYILSFVYIGIYWNNHHHLLQASHRVTGGALWANLHLLFWLSITPFATWWMGESHFQSAPVACYGVVLLMCGVAYGILTLSLIKTHGQESILGRAVGTGTKEIASIAAYVVAVLAAFWLPWVSFILYLSVAILWVIPDKRIERQLTEKVRNDWRN